jgi:hypothetical protein
MAAMDSGRRSAEDQGTTAHRYPQMPVAYSVDVTPTHGFLATTNW